MFNKFLTLVFICFIAMAYYPCFVHSQEPTGMQSDDFTDSILDTTIWTFHNPLADVAVEMTGSQLALILPAGQNHDAWRKFNSAPRIMQPANDTNFVVEVKFVSPLTAKIQDHGILIQESISRFLRFDIYYDGTDCRAFAALVDGDIVRVKLNNIISEGSPMWLRVQRFGDQWTLFYSLDDRKWIPVTEFSQTLKVTEVGLYAGNIGNGDAPAYTLLADYFTAREIEPEVNAPDTLFPIITNTDSRAFENAAEISWSTDEKTTGRVVYGLSTAYGFFTESQDLQQQHTVVLHGLNASTTYHYQITAADSSGNATLSSDLFFTTQKETASFRSDDFNAFDPDTSIWTLVNPLGDATFEMTGTHLVISVPGGVDHDAWKSGNSTARAMQRIKDEDFELEVKFESIFDRRTQDQGLIVEESSDLFLRFDLLFDGTNTRAFVAFIDSGVARIEANTIISATTPVWLRVNRSGNNWKYSHSIDGSSWTEISAFSRKLAVKSVGVYAGNAGGLGAPATAVLVDYCFNTAQPIVPEDGNFADITAPVISDLNFKSRASSASIAWTSDEYTTGLVDFGLTPAYGEVTESKGFHKRHEIVLTNLAQNTRYYFRITASDVAGNVALTNEEVFHTKTDTTGPVLDVWYGLNQQIGHLGDAQDDFNLLGNVFDSSGVASLDFVLNGGVQQSLKIGDRPDGFGDGRRLAATGDFNADIPVNNLIPGLNTIELSAMDTEGNSSTQLVQLELKSGASMLPYSNDWTTVENGQEAGQFIDGHWGTAVNGLRILETGYDRMFLIGERTWRDYEITVPVTINNVDTILGPYGGDPGLGIIMRFTGHITGGFRNWPETQPKYGFLPFGGLGFLRWTTGAEESPRLQFLRGDNGHASSHGLFPLAFGTTYWMKMRCQTLPDSSNGDGVTQYSFKIWPFGLDEPPAWNWQQVQSSEHALRQGGVALVAHYVDARFGNINISEIAAWSEIPVGINDIVTTAGHFALSYPFPNPFNPTTSFIFSAARGEQVRVEIFNLLGQRVALLHDGFLEQKDHQFHFNAGRLASGLYFIRATGAGFALTRRITLNK